MAARIPATEAGAEVFVRFAKNPLTWLVIFASVYGLSQLWGRVTGSAAEEDEAAKPESVSSNDA